MLIPQTLASIKPHFVDCYVLNSFSEFIVVIAWWVIAKSWIVSWMHIQSKHAFLTNECSPLHCPIRTYCAVDTQSKEDEKVWVDVNAVFITAAVIPLVSRLGEVSIFQMQKWRILTTKTHLSTVLEAFPEDSNQSKWMREVWVGGTAAWLAAAAPRAPVSSWCFQAISYTKMRFLTCFFQQSKPLFQHHGPIYYQFDSLGRGRMLVRPPQQEGRREAASQAETRVFSLPLCRWLSERPK